MGLFDSLKNMFGPEKLNVAERFEIKRKATAGTMSDFYLVEDRASRMPFGLKIVNMQKLAEVDARFKGIRKPSEADIALVFDHPFIVKTFECGTTTKGELYLLMEYLGGGGMNHVLTQNPGILDGKRVLYLTQGATAVAEVHAKGYLHRDICPRNFILNSDRSVMKLTDFGLSVPATPQFMQAGNRTGTPKYMAPELVRRRPTNIQVDVFAFGVSAYEIMTGKLPWEGGTDGRAALAHDNAPTPIQRYRPNIHPTLARAIHQCIEPDQGKRFPSLTPFLQLLSAVKTEDVA